MDTPQTQTLSNTCVALQSNVPGNLREMFGFWQVDPKSGWK